MANGFGKWQMDDKQLTAPLRIQHNNISDIFSYTNNQLHTNDFNNDHNSTWPGENSSSLFILVVLYGVVVFGGIFGNASLVITLCSQPSGRLRNPLLVALCLADLLVSGVSAPLTIIALAMANSNSAWMLPSAGCKTIHFMQLMPVAASTLCLLMLSLDRYATVKHPRLAQFRQRRFLPAVLATGSWISACILCAPILFAQKNVAAMKDKSAGPLSTQWLNCEPDYGSPQAKTAFILVHTCFVYIIPSVGVLLNHLGVRKKLCALSLTARAAHGELPLPMPILRRPTHMIIVTGMANAARGVVDNESFEDVQNGAGDQQQNGNTNGKTANVTRASAGRKFLNSSGRPIQRTPRSMRHSQMQQNRAKRATEINSQPAPELPLPQTSTLRSRRRLANMLVAAAIIFAGCWTPHIICILCVELNAIDACPQSVVDFGQLLGYAHSAVSPILYWALNHNSLRQSSCSPCNRFTSAHNFLRSHLRAQPPPPPPSSTNEAALGPFNPRYIKARPQPICRAPASSHYLY